jgi:ketosteroid isomerase-like protein
VNVRGRAAARQIIESWVGTWLEYTFDVDELVDAGEVVLLAVKETGRGKGSGLPMEHRFCMAWTIRDGRVVRCVCHDDLAHARAALASPSGD